MRERALQTPKPVQKGAGSPPGSRADSPAPHGEDCGEAAVPWQPMEAHGYTEIHPPAACVGLMPEQGVPKGSCYPVGSPCWSRLLAGLVDPCRVKPTLNQVFWQHL